MVSEQGRSQGGWENRHAALMKLLQQPHDFVGRFRI